MIAVNGSSYKITVNGSTNNMTKVNGFTRNMITVNGHMNKVK